MIENKGMENLFDQFLSEASDLLTDIEFDLEKLKNVTDTPNVLENIFNTIHVLKGGAGFFNANYVKNMEQFVTLCKLTEEVLYKLRIQKLQFNPYLLGVVIDANAQLRNMLLDIKCNVQVRPISKRLLNSFYSIQSSNRTSMRNYG